MKRKHQSIYETPLVADLSLIRARLPINGFARRSLLATAALRRLSNTPLHAAFFRVATV